MLLNENNIDFLPAKKLIGISKIDKFILTFVFSRSTQMIFQDADHALMSVSLFHKAVEDFKNKVNSG